MWREVDSSKGFKRIQLTRAKFPLFVALITDLVRPLTEASWYDDEDPMYVVISRGNKSPMHQDIQTGGNVYEDSLDMYGILVGPNSDSDSEFPNLGHPN